MKALYYILPIAAVALFSSCEDDKAVTAPSPFGPARGGMAAMVEGTQWTSTGQNTQLTNTDGNATIVGTELVGANYSRQITLHIKGLNAKGTYKKDKVQASITISNTQQSVNGSSQKTWRTTTNDASDVKVVISEYDQDARRISGTFRFTALSESSSDAVRNVTEGAFQDVKF